MITHVSKGTGVSGALAYLIGEGNDPETNDRRPDAAIENESRVAWFGGQGFGFEIETKNHLEIARRVMEWAALPQNQASKTRPCKEDAYHFSLSWAPDETPSRADMEAAAKSALKALGMENARAIFVSHDDTDHAHVHVLASKINPETGRAYDTLRDMHKLDTWALAYEREHGGIRCEARAIKEQIAELVKTSRNPASILEKITAERATFDRRDLDSMLFKSGLRDKNARAALIDGVLAEADIVPLRERGAKEATRYTTQSVIDTERAALAHFDRLSEAGEHWVTSKVMRQTMTRLQAEGRQLSDEQAQAILKLTGKEGVAVLDGKAGTGKSFTLAVVREMYEAQGNRVIGLSYTNAVVADMKRDGFGYTATLTRELGEQNRRETMTPEHRVNYDRLRASKDPNYQAAKPWDSKTVVMVDETGMVPGVLIAELGRRAAATGAKLILAGDEKQFGGMERGGLFGAVQERLGDKAASLRTIIRQKRDDDKAASRAASEYQFKDALANYDAQGRVTWADERKGKLAAAINAWAADSKADPDKSRMIYAASNKDVNALNAGARLVLQRRGKLGPDTVLETAHGMAGFAVGDRAGFTDNAKRKGIIKGERGVITSVSSERVTIDLDGTGKEVAFNPQEFKGFRHAYAGTLYKGQGQTVDAAYIVHSANMRGAGAYVGLTRHRDSAQIFASREEAGGGTTWMHQTDGMGNLPEALKLSAAKSYEKWAKANPALGQKHDLADYVRFVQKRTEAEQPAREAARLDAMAAKMARADDRRSAAQFDHDYRPITTLETTAEKAQGFFSRVVGWLRRDKPEDAPVRAQGEAGMKPALRDNMTIKPAPINTESLRDISEQLAEAARAERDTGKDGGKNKERSIRDPLARALGSGGKEAEQRRKAEAERMAQKKRDRSKDYGR